MVINRRRIRVEWGHCDPAGIVFYPQYFAWFDACTAYLFESVGMAPSKLYQEFGLKGMPLVEASAKFQVPSGFGDDIDAQSSIVEWTNKSFKVHHRFLRGETLLLEGWETRVLVIVHPDDPARIKAVPIPDAIVKRLGGQRQA